MDIDQIKNALRSHLESELTLGARWQPQGLSSASDPSTDIPSVGSVITPQQKQYHLDEIAALVAQCQKCPLAHTRLNTVPGQGDPNARIVFVGEAPGQKEDEQGLPFVGRAGQLLTKIIQAMGLTRDDVFICNILKCRPPENRNPQLAEVVECSPYLHEQLKIIQPAVIVALGSHAAKTLLETTTPIGQLRGKIHQYVPGPMADPIPLVATYHPAYLLRNYTPDTRRRVWEDMQRVLEYVGLPVPNPKAK